MSHHRTVRRIFLLSLLLSICTTAAARDIYVNNLGGDDRFDGRTPLMLGDRNGPCHTIARALRAALPGDRVVLAKTDKPYRESITLQGASHSGSPRFPFVIQGNGAVLDGSAPVGVAAWQHVRDNVFRFRLARLSHQQLFLEDTAAVRRRDIGTNGKLPDLQPRQWCLLKGLLYFRVEQDKLPQDYRITHTHHTVGITLYDVRNVVIRDLTVQGYQLDGINAHDGVSGCRLVNLVARGNGRSGISVGGASRVKIQQCLIGNNGASQLRTEGHCKTQVVHCDLIASAAPAWAMEGGRLWIDGKWMGDGTVNEE